MLPHIVTILTHGLTIFARGGGGGSGGGGGGGGGFSGGSSSGSGSGGDAPFFFFMLLGYLPASFWASLVRRKLNDANAITGALVGTLAYSGFWLFLAFGAHFWWGIMVALCALVGGVGGYRGWGQQYIRKIGKAKKELAQAAEADPAWDVNALHDTVRETFFKFQADWSTFNIKRMKTYLTDRYWQHMSLVMAAIKLRNRRNDVQQPVFTGTPEPISVNDFADNDKDTVTFMMNARAHDVLLEQIDGEERELFADNNSFTEYWNFIRSGNSWKLDGISQATESAYMLRPQIEAFAKSNGMFYSRDWGWLLLPSRGVLFSGGRFGRSDINNHVIGLYHKLIIELYTYLPNTTGNNSNQQQYVVAQVALPKRYDSLIVEAKQGGLLSRFQKAPSGYNKLSLEWADFNKRYNVFATNVEQVTAFELLHPVYMEKLFALPFKVSIEVVDNVVYLYTQDRQADYSTMYSILQDAFEEMKL